MSRKPTRDQLARFLPTPELVRAFESLFDLAAGDTGAVDALRAALTALSVRTDGLQLSLNDNETTDAAEHARISAVVAAMSDLAGAVEALAMAPVPTNDNDVPANEIRWKVKSISADHVAACGEWLDCDASGGTITITPPNIDGSTGRMIAVCKSDASTNQVVFNATTNGAASAFTTVQYTTMLLVSNGTEWRLM